MSTGPTRGCLRRVWFKLTHRDMARLTLSRPEVPNKSSSGKPIPAVNHTLIGHGDRLPQGQDPGFRLSVSALVSTAWASRPLPGSDKRGGANGARIRLAPQKDWEVNHLPSCEGAQDLESIRRAFNSAASGERRYPG